MVVTVAAKPDRTATADEQLADVASEHLGRVGNGHTLAQCMAVDVDDEGVQPGDVRVGGYEFGPLRNRRRR